MRSTSKNRFSRIVIKKAPYASFGTAVKYNTSITRIDHQEKITKPIKGAVSAYDHLIIAGSAL